MYFGHFYFGPQANKDYFGGYYFGAIPSIGGGPPPGGGGAGIREGRWTPPIDHEAIRRSRALRDDRDLLEILSIITRILN